MKDEVVVRVDPRQITIKYGGKHIVVGGRQALFALIKASAAALEMGEK